MTGLVVALPPVSNFPGGALTYAFHASALLDSPIYAPGGLAREFCPLHLKLNSFPYISNVTKYDYSLITTFGKDSEKYLSNLPKPIVAVIHDGHTLYEFGGKEWTKNIDGFLVDVEPTKRQIMEFVKNASMLRIPIPYKKKEFNIDNNDNRENAIISLGRIVPERGHRLVATLSSLGYKVYVVGQEVRHDEYGLYYAKVCASGAEVISTPSDEEKNKIISRVKVSMSFPFTYEIDEPIEYCFPAGTNIVIKHDNDSNSNYPYGKSGEDSGWCKIKKIENIVVGDMVLTYDDKLYEKTFHKVSGISSRKTDKIIYAKFSNGNELRLTPNHPVAVINDGKIDWINALELCIGDKVVQYKYDGFGRDLYGISKRGKIPLHLINNDVRKIVESKKKDNVLYQKVLRENAHDLGLISGKNNIGSKRNVATKEKMSKSAKERFKDPEFCKEWGRSHHVVPSGLEVYFLSLLDDWFSGQWKYVGDGKISIDGKIPDYKHNVANKVIELNGTYWHQGENENDKIEFYNNRGFDCIVIWDKDLQDLESVKNKVEQFTLNPNIDIVEITNISKDWRCEEIGHTKSGFELLYKKGLISIWKRGNVYTIEKGFENIHKMRANTIKELLDMPQIAKIFIISPIVDNVKFPEKFEKTNPDKSKIQIFSEPLNEDLEIFKKLDKEKCRNDYLFRKDDFVVLYSDY